MRSGHFAQHTNTPCSSGLVASARRLEDALQRQQAFAPQLDLFSSEPHVVTRRYRLFFELDAELIVFDQPLPHLVAAATWFFPGLEAKLVSLDPPLAAALVTHGCDRERAVSLEDFAPMRFVRQLHPREFCLNLRARELLEFLLGRGR